MRFLLGLALLSVVASQTWLPNACDPNFETEEAGNRFTCTTVDANANGRIDGVQCRLVPEFTHGRAWSGIINNGFLTSYDNWHLNWQVSEFVVTGYSVIDDEHILLDLMEGWDGDTAYLPTVRYMPRVNENTDALLSCTRDDVTNGVIAYSSSLSTTAVVATKGTTPRLITVVHGPPHYMYLSEAIVYDTASINALIATLGTITYDDNSGGQTEYVTDASDFGNPYGGATPTQFIYWLNGYPPQLASDYDAGDPAKGFYILGQHSKINNRLAAYPLSPTVRDLDQDGVVDTLDVTFALGPSASGGYHRPWPVEQTEVNSFRNGGFPKIGGFVPSSFTCVKSCPDLLAEVRYPLPAQLDLGIDTSYAPTVLFGPQLPFGAAEVVALGLDISVPSPYTRASIDGSPPLMLAYSSHVGSNQTLLHWSEPVSARAGVDLMAAYPNGCEFSEGDTTPGGLVAPSSVSFVGNAAVFQHADQAVLADFDFPVSGGTGLQSLRCPSTLFEDAAGLISPHQLRDGDNDNVAYLENDANVVPVVSVMLTADDDTNGEVDRVLVTFDFPMDFTSIAGTIECAPDCVAGIPTQAGVDSMNVPVTGFNHTAATPIFDFRAFKIHDLDGNYVDFLNVAPSSALTSVDGVVSVQFASGETRPAAAAAMEYKMAMLPRPGVGNYVGDYKDITCAGTAIASQARCAEAWTAVNGGVAVPVASFNGPTGCMGVVQDGVITGYSFEAGASPSFDRVPVDATFVMLCDGAARPNIPVVTASSTYTGACPGTPSTDGAFDQDTASYWSSEPRYYSDQGSCDAGNGPLTSVGATDGEWDVTHAGPYQGETVTVAGFTTTVPLFYRVQSNARAFQLWGVSSSAAPTGAPTTAAPTTATASPSAAPTSTQAPTPMWAGTILLDAQAGDGSDLSDKTFSINNPGQIVYEEYVLVITHVDAANSNAVAKVYEITFFDDAAAQGGSSFSQALDAAGPVLLRVEGQAAAVHDHLRLWFSEPVVSATRGPTFFVNDTGRYGHPSKAVLQHKPGGITYTNGQASSIQSVRPSGWDDSSGEYVEMVFSGDHLTIEDFLPGTNDALVCDHAQNPIRDAAGNNCVIQSVDVVNDDQVAPTLLSMYTTGSGGWVDFVTLRFDEPMQEGAFGLTDITFSWSGPAPTNPTVNQTTSSSCCLDEFDIVVSLNRPSVPASDMTAVVATSSVTDANLNAFVVTGFTSEDRVSPAVFTFKALDGESTATVVLSEPIATCDATCFNAIITGLSLVSATEDSPTTYTLTFDGPISGAQDFGTGTVGLTTVAKDLAAVPNDGDSTPATLSDGDLTPPEVSSGLTSAMDPTGYISHIQLTFTEDVVLTGSGTASEWGFTVDGYTTGDVTQTSPSTIEIGVSSGSATPDGHAVPLVQYTVESGFDISDVAGNSMVDFADMSTSDGVEPILLRATAFGGASEVRLYFSENVGSVIAADFDSAALTFTTMSQADTTGDLSAIASVNRAIVIADFDNGTSVEVAAASSITDMAGNAVVVGQARFLDRADMDAPTVPQFNTGGDGSGNVTGIVVQFAEPLSEFSLLTLEHDSAGPIGYTLDVSIISAGVVIISLEGIYPAGTALELLVNFTATDLSGNEVSSTTATTDTTEPVLLFAGGLPGEPDFVVTFSEDLAPGGHVFLNGSMIPLTPVAGNGPDYIANFDVAVAHIGMDVTANVTDMSGIPSDVDATVVFINADTVPPVVKGIVTVDMNMDGYLDGVIVNFTKDMKPDNPELIEMTVGGNITVNASAIRFLAGDMLYVEFNAADQMSMMTDEVVVVNYTGSITKLKSVTGLDLVPFSIQADDGARPVLLSAEAIITATGSSIVLTFSEGVDTSATGSEAVNPPFDLKVINGAAETLIGVDLQWCDVTDCDGSDGMVTLTPNPRLTVADLMAMTIEALPNAIYDSSGNAMSAGVAVPLTRIETNSSVLLTATTYSSNNDGVTDSVLVTLSKPVDVSTTFATSDFVFPGGLTVTSVTGLNGGIDTQVVVMVDGVTSGIDVASSGGLDLNGNQIASASLTVTDGVGPAVESAIGTGGSATVEVVFTESVSGVTAASFVVNPFRNVTAVTGSGTTYTLVFADAFSAADFQGGTSITMAPSNAVVDAAGNVAVDYPRSLTTNDVTGPVLVSASVVGAADGSNQLAQLVLVFDEAVDDSSYAVAHFAVTHPGYSLAPSGLVNTGVPNDNTLVITLIAPGSNTASAFNVTYTPGTLKDLSGNLALALNMPTTDMAAPVVDGDMTGVIGSTDIHLTYSEPVFSSSGGPVQPSDIVLTGTTKTVVSIQDDGMGGLVLTLSAALDSADIGVISAGAATDQVVDARGNKVGSSQMLLSPGDGAPPMMSKARTLDTDNNGKLDQIVIEFNEAILDSTLDMQDWAVAGRAIANISTGAVMNDGVIILQLVEALVTDTGAVPEITYTPGSLTDSSSNAMEAGTLVPVDRARPVVVRITGEKNGEIVFVTFSEAVVDIVDSDRTYEKFTYIASDNNKGASKIVSLKDGDGRDATLAFTVDKQFHNLDFGADSVSIVDGAVEDAAGNLLNATTMAVAQDGERILTTVEPFDDMTKIIVGCTLGGILCCLIIIIIILAVCRNNKKKRTMNLDADEIMAEFDTNKDGVLDATELAAYVLSSERDLQKEEGEETDATASATASGGTDDVEL